MRWWCNFVAEDRGQFFLMPPWIAEWLLEDHLAHFVLDVVEEMDLAGFYVGNRAGGWGGAARRGIPRRWSRCCSPTAPVISSSQIECACFTAGIRTRRIRASQSPARLGRLQLASMGSGRVSPSLHRHGLWHRLMPRMMP